MIRISVYLAAAYYRLANLSSAEKYLKPLMKIKTDQGNTNTNMIMKSFITNNIY